MREQARIAIAAGGTAGHVVPALAVADALRERGAEVLFIGGDRAVVCRDLAVPGGDCTIKLCDHEVFGRDAVVVADPRAVVCDVRAVLGLSS